jgi:hypothetical protein
MRAWIAGLAVVLALPAAAQAPESVTVTGTRSRQVLDQFVESFAAPNRLTGKIARWEDGICPVAVGLKPAFLGFITQRMRNVAAKAGAPIDDHASCKPNIEIVFTTTPQALLDNVRKQNEPFLGYADSSGARKKLATVTRPIQAWYTTATKDLRGKKEVDSAKGGGITIRLPAPVPHGSAAAVDGSRLRDGMRSTFYHIIIVADPRLLVDYEIGAVADYVSMLALTQLSSLDACQQLPSIVNMLAPGCARLTMAMTDNDAAYLRGLYHMTPDMIALAQENEVAYQMEKGLESQ